MIKIQPARVEQASEIATLIMEAMNHECCRWFAGPDHTLEDFHQLMTRLVKREDSQYSYLNTVVAMDGDKLVGICTSYDGARLHELRKAFVEEAKETFGIDYSGMDDETKAGELYIDSLCVRREYRHQGIAKQLLQTCKDKAKSLGIPMVGLLVDQGNPSAEVLYESVGFLFVDETVWGGHPMRHLVYKVLGKTWVEIVKEELRTRFNPMSDKEEEEDTIESIISGIRFRGAQLWILIFAIFIASLGLNVNSTAVIIGAMLVSPLMGPIIGMGLAIGISDWQLFKTSAYNFFWATIISIITATVYFFISPFNEVQSELLARTSPTLYDVLIAFFGGAAGFMAIATKGKGNVIPGVAIATALMPPLCTAGFGLATGRPMYFFGALYLFFINTVFICLSTYLGTRLLKFQQKKMVDPVREKRVHQYIIAIVLVTLIPAAFITVNLFRQSIFQRNVGSYVKNEWNLVGTQIIANEADLEQKRLQLIAVGLEVPDDSIEVRRNRLKDYHLEDFSLQVIQGTQTDSLIMLNKRISQMAENASDKTQTIRDQQRHITELEIRLQEYSYYENLVAQLRKEAESLYPAVSSLAIASMSEAKNDSVVTPIVTVIVESKSNLTNEQKTSLRRWLQTRTESDTLRVIYN